MILPTCPQPCKSVPRSLRYKVLQSDQITWYKSQQKNSVPFGRPCRLLDACGASIVPRLA